VTTEVPGYRLAETLAHGRRGPLRAGVRLDDHQRVVVHLVRAQLDRAARSRLQARVRQLRELPPAPSVVPLLAAGPTTDGHAYLVTPRMERSLSDLVGVEGPLPLDLVLSAGNAILNALAVLHANQVVHGNITPANLLIRADGAVALTGPRIDVLDEITDVGPVTHLPPEAVRAGLRTTAGDVYMAGSTLWTLLTGRAPYPDLPSMLGQRLPALERADTPDELAAVLRSMLASEPADRPPDTAGLTRTLAAVASGGVRDAGPVGLAGPAGVADLEAGGGGASGTTLSPPLAASAAAPGRDLLPTNPRRAASGPARPGRGPDARRVGKYWVLEPLGTGGSATVWRAEDDQGRVVALKELRPEYRTSPEMLHRFHQELGLLPSLNHAHLVPALDVIIDPDAIALVMPLYGTDLRGVLREAPMDRGRYIRVLHQVAAALDFLHQHGVVHRDVKPDNVLVERRDPVLVRLTDLGIARIPDLPGITASDRQPGTLAYMAPELFDGGGPVTSAIDVYAFGVMMYELLSGHRPFEGIPAAVAYKHLTVPPPRPDGVSAAAWDLLARCLAKDAAARPSARELPRLLRALPEAAPGGRPDGLASPLSVPRPEQRPAHRPARQAPSEPPHQRGGRSSLNSVAATSGGGRQPALVAAVGPAACEPPGAAASEGKSDGDRATEDQAPDGSATQAPAPDRRAAEGQALDSPANGSVARSVGPGVSRRPPDAEDRPLPRVGTVLRAAVAVAVLGMVLGLLWGLSSVLTLSSSGGRGGSARTTSPAATNELVSVKLAATAVSPVARTIEVDWSADPAAPVATGIRVKLLAPTAVVDDDDGFTAAGQVHQRFDRLDATVLYCVFVEARVPKYVATGAAQFTDPACLRADGSGQPVSATGSPTPPPAASALPTTSPSVGRRPSPSATTSRSPVRSSRSPSTTTSSSGASGGLFGPPESSAAASPSCSLFCYSSDP